MGFDVFNALDLMENKKFLEPLKFGIGDGNLQYYLYNWRCPTMTPDKVRTGVFLCDYSAIPVCENETKKMHERKLVFRLVNLTYAVFHLSKLVYVCLY